MREQHPKTKSGPDNGAGTETPVSGAVAELTPKAEAKAANKLPKAEQLYKFEEELEAIDSGNQPA